WAFRDHSVHLVQAVSDLNGRPMSLTVHRRNGKAVQVALPRDNSLPAPSMLTELRRRVAAEISRYRTGGLCTGADLALVEALWVEGKSLRQHARERGVAAQAISDHIERLRHRCPRFYRW